LRQAVGDHDFFAILEGWATTQAGGTVTTREFIDLAESISKEELDPLFEDWLSSGKPSIDTGPGQGQGGKPAFRDLPAASKSLVQRLHDRPGNPFPDAKGRER
jgi:hypothetical protein